MQAAAGPDEATNPDFDPMVATSDTPGNNDSFNATVVPAANASASRANVGNATAANSSCVDVPAPGSITCEQQKGWGKCKDMLAAG